MYNRLLVVFGVIEGFYLDRHGLPVAVNATSEAISARRQWFERPSSTLFLHVHIHKCGGMTLEQIIPRILLGASRNDLCPKEWAIDKDKRKPVCLLRQHGMPMDEGVDWVRSHYDGEPPNYASSISESGAYQLLPWQLDTIKFVMVRDPWARAMSEMKFHCRVHNNPSVLYHVRDMGKKPRSHTLLRNVLESHMLPERDFLSQSSITNTTIVATATKRIAAFGFIGVVERFASSLCLFARTFTKGNGRSHHSICEFCCLNNTVPIHNQAPESHELCDFDFDKDDEFRYKLLHRADYRIYDIATEIFDRRLDLAVNEQWGGNPERDCNCEVHPDHTPSSRTPFQRRSYRHSTPISVRSHAYNKRNTTEK